MMTKITVKGKYTGSNPRGIIVGGTHLVNNGHVHTMLVDEQCYSSLLAGEKNGWFKIIEDNYERFCISRLRPVPKKNVIVGVDLAVETPAIKEAPAEEPVAKEVPAEEPVVEEAPAEEKKPAKKKASTKKKD